MQCLFLGYSPQHKGYKCHHPPIGHLYISRDVIFKEKIFPCKQNLLVQNPTTPTPSQNKSLPTIIHIALNPLNSLENGPPSPQNISPQNTVIHTAFNPLTSLENGPPSPQNPSNQQHIQPSPQLIIPTPITDVSNDSPENVSPNSP